MILVAGEFLNNEGSGLYFLQSKINHSCVPNAESTFPYSNDIVVLKAIKAIQPGEEICISYIDECQLDRSRHSRQKVYNISCFKIIQMINYAKISTKCYYQYWYFFSVDFER